MKYMKRLPALLSTIIFAIIVLGCNEPVKDKSENTTSVQANDDSSWALIPFIKIDSANPIMLPGKGEFICPLQKRKILWEEKDVFNPAIAVRGDTVYMLYRAQDKIGKPDGTSRIGLAESTDGIHFTRHRERHVWRLLRVEGRGMSAGSPRVPPELRMILFCIRIIPIRLAHRR
jgi:hypothetical protein